MRIFLFKLFLLSSLVLSAQNNINIELQAYPTGIIPSIGIAKAIQTHSEIHFRLGANLIDHQDFGVQDSEKGKGFGGSISYLYFRSEVHKGIFAGVRSDLWRNSLEWSNGQEPVIATGVSKILVLQPTAILGYRHIKSDKNWFIQPTLSFGREFNIHTKGAEIGQGWILLFGLSLGLNI